MFLHGLPLKSTLLTLVEKRLYKAYKRGCTTAFDSIAIKSTEDKNAMESITYHRGSLETALKKWHRRFKNIQKPHIQARL